MPAVTANERFKQSSRSSVWIGLIAATLLHAALFIASPVFALDPHVVAEVPPTRLIQPDVPLPPPPAPIQAPAAPVISVDVPVEATLDPVTPDEWKERPLAPPAPAEDGSPGVPFTPMEVAPRLLNGAEIQRALQRHYPPLLRDAGIGGTVAVWFHIDARGRVVETRLQRGSGYEALDAAALAVADEMSFAPAMNREKRVPVWVALDITFEVRR